MLTFFILIGAGAIYVAVLFYTNRTVRPLSGAIALPNNAPTLPPAEGHLSVLTWNIGYAALGKEADMIIDKGRSLRALSRDDIRRNAQAIASRLRSQDVDVICLQENAAPGFLTRQVPLRWMIDQALATRINLFWGDMKTVFVPSFLRLEHGMSVHSRANLQSCRTLDLPQDDIFFFGLLKKHYGGMISRLPIGDTGQDWVVINIHLSAFDAKGIARQLQLQELMLFAQGQHKLGHFVVIAGDWNMRLAATDFTHRSDIDGQLWATDFPDEVLQEGWQVAVDPKTPTVRALQTPYVLGQTFTTILDGFVYAPNVELTRVHTSDLWFEHSDHQPVEAAFTAKRPAA